MVPGITFFRLIFFSEETRSLLVQNRPHVKSCFSEKKNRLYVLGRGNVLSGFPFYFIFLETAVCSPWARY